MANTEDIARLTYVIDNYDSVEILTDDNGDRVLSEEFRNSDNTEAQMLKFSKKIDGTYYVVEAVPDSSYKKMWVISAYTKKEGITQVPDAAETAPGATPEAKLPYPPSDSIISQINRKSNTSDKNNYPFSDKAKKSMSKKDVEAFAESAKQKYSVDDSEVTAYDSKKDLIRDCYDIFSIPEGNRKELRSLINSFAEGYIKKGSFTEEDRNKLFDRLYSEGVMTVAADDYFKEGRDTIAGGKIFVKEQRAFALRSLRLRKSTTLVQHFIAQKRV